MYAYYVSKPFPFDRHKKLVYIFGSLWSMERRAINFGAAEMDVEDNAGTTHTANGIGASSSSATDTDHASCVL